MHTARPNALGLLAATAIVAIGLIAVQPASQAHAAGSSCIGFIPSTITTAANLIAAVNQAESANCPGADVIDLDGQSITFTSASGDTALPTITSSLSIINGTLNRVSSSSFRFLLVDASGSLTLEDLTVSNGLGPATGDVGGGAVLNRGRLSVAGVEFLENSAGADGDGGAIRNEGTLAMSDSEIRLGDARAGGAVDNAGTATILRTSLYDNDASNGAGGGILSSGSLTLRDSVLFMNASTTGGAGLHLEAAPSTTPTWSIVNVTIADNDGPFGYYQAGGGVSISNSILAGNDGGPDCGAAVGTTVAAALTNLVENDGCAPAGTQLNADPMFSPPSGFYPYRLTAASPAVDSGTDDGGSSLDLDGSARVKGAAIDMGAYERVPQVITVEFGAATSSRGEDQSLGDVLTITTSDTEATGTASTVTIAVTGGTATAADYVLGGTITIPAGVAHGATASIASGFSIVDDAIVEATETVTLELSAPTGSVLGARTSTTHSITDDDVAGFSITTPASTIMESAVATFTIVATSQPSGTIVLDLATSDSTECTVSPATLSFDAATWSTPRTVTITAVDDHVVDGTQPCAVTFGRNAASTAADYPVGLTPADVTVSVADQATSAGAASQPLASTGSQPLGIGVLVALLIAAGVAATLQSRRRLP